MSMRLATYSKKIQIKSLTNKDRRLANSVYADGREVPFIETHVNSETLSLLFSAVYQTERKLDLSLVCRPCYH